MGTILYLVKESLRGLFSARLMTVVSVMTIAVALFCIGVATVVLLNVQRKLDETSLRMGMVAYCADGTADSSSRIDSLTRAISILPQVRELVFISRDSARARFIAQYGTEMLEATEGNPLPASFEIHLRGDKLDKDNVEQLRATLSALPGIEGVDYSREFAEKLSRFRKAFLTGCAIAGPLLLAALFIIITNTIRLTIFARRDLITNMQFVGATSLFIKTPFILEGVLQGFMGGLCAVAGLGVLRIALSGQALYTGSGDIYTAVVLLGAIIGFFASVGAVRRFLA